MVCPWQSERSEDGRDDTIRARLGNQAQNNEFLRGFSRILLQPVSIIPPLLSIIKSPIILPLELLPAGVTHDLLQAPAAVQRGAQGGEVKFIFCWEVSPRLTPAGVFLFWGGGGDTREQLSIYRHHGCVGI